jgi:hypothetical protein
MSMAKRLNILPSPPTSTVIGLVPREGDIIFSVFKYPWNILSRKCCEFAVEVGTTIDSLLYTTESTRGIKGIVTA